MRAGGKHPPQTYTLSKSPVLIELKHRKNIWRPPTNRQSRGGGGGVNGPYMCMVSALHVAHLKFKQYISM